MLWRLILAAIIFALTFGTGWDTYQPNDSFVQKIDAEGNLVWGDEGIKLKP